MKDIDFRSALQDYVVHDEPPLTLAEHTVVSASKHERRLRTYATLGTVTAVVAAVTTGISLLPDRNAPPQLDKAAPVSCPAKVPSETDAQLKARLECVLGNAIRAELEPGARIETQLFHNGSLAAARSTGDTLALVGGRDIGRFTLSFKVIDSQGTGSAQIELVLYDKSRDPKGALGDCARYLRETNSIACRDEPGPRDGVLTLRTEGVNGAEDNSAEFNTPDSRITVEGFNYVKIGPPQVLVEAPTASRTRPLFDWAQLAKIATDPGLAT
ncbi:hypothetical protein SAMN05421504_103727 [Amycolatopsis xylanica]|uniref:Uncharacterized protein n=1 Tax=Amycolatopsis xylanica TaxID=589385 RepID=A0A1H3ECW1_9PSEU|nr:hypothetical protein [Amycolatopsis xylanica]SDX75754.1 hypothetical protein SAMN05421504_103727 [Amycolatopsis xylanica]